MKTLKFEGTITSIRGLADRGVSFIVHTARELPPSEKAYFFDYQNLICDFTIEPKDQPSEGQMVIDRKVEGKTPSKRLYGVLYAWWKQQGEPGSFDMFYLEKMNDAIDKIKERLD